MSEPIPGFGARLRALRKGRGLSRAEACRLCGGIAVSTWDGWESCPSPDPTRHGPYPSADKLRKMIEGLDMHPHELFELVSGEEVPPCAS